MCVRVYVTKPQICTLASNSCVARCAYTPVTVHLINTGARVLTWITGAFVDIIYKNMISFMYSIFFIFL